jgi:methyltransferase
MEMSRVGYLGLLGLVGLCRILELRLSARNKSRMKARGAETVPDPDFPKMVFLHVGVLASAAGEVGLLHRPLIPALAWSMGTLFVLANLLRWWVIASLSEHWNVQVVDSRRLGIVTRGPYRWVRHPNYVAVFVELIALPLLHTAWLTSLWVTAGDVWLLRRRIQLEETLLLANPEYSVTMGNKPRFLPRLLERESGAVEQTGSDTSRRR